MMEGLTVLLESSSAPLRAKALVALALLARLSPTWILTAFRKGLLTQARSAFCLSTYGMTSM